MLKTTAPSIQPSFFDNICQDGLKRNVRLAKIDRLLSEIPDFLGPFIAAYEKDRKAQGIDENNGKPTISLETIIRLILLRHLHINCTFRDVEDRTTTDMSWKAFAKLRFTDTVPDFTTIAKWQAFFGEEAVKALHDALVAHLVGKKVIKGRRMRTDTTVVPANIHYPTDATLLADAVKVITRTVKRFKLKTIMRSKVNMVKRHLYGIAHSLKNRTGHAKAVVFRATRKIMEITRTVVRQGKDAAKNMPRKAAKDLCTYLARAQRLIEQTERRVKGLAIKDRMVSFFQPSMRPIVKGKMSTPCEFGQKLEVVEVEHGIVSDFKLHIGNPSDHNLLMPALDRHQARFGHDPSKVATDRGYWSETQAVTLKGRGIAKVSIPKRGHKTKCRLRTERSVWFKELQRWRAGGEAKISWLKRSFGLGKSRAKTEQGYAQGVAWGIMGCNLRVAAGLV